MDELLTLVDRDDNTLGYDSKLSIHKKGLLHRAFSIFIFNQSGKLLLQQRALEKYHSAGLWTNSCCGHPRWKEDTHSAATRRLSEEMGITTDLTHVGSFLYQAHMPELLIEHELDHIYIGFFNKEPQANPEEAVDWKWIDLSALESEIKSAPEKFTAWFKIIIEKTGMKKIEEWKEKVNTTQ